MCFFSGEPHRSSSQSCLTTKCFESTIKHCEKSREYPSLKHIPNEATAIALCYHAVGGVPDEQLEKLFVCCQVIFIIRSLNIDDSLVRLPVKGDVPHLRTSGFDCGETTITGQQRGAKPEQPEGQQSIWSEMKEERSKTCIWKFVAPRALEVWECCEVSGKHWNPSLSSQVGITYFLEVNPLCHGASALETKGHLQNDDGTEISEADRVAITLLTFYCRVQFGVAVDGGEERHWPICPRLQESLESNSVPRFNFLYGVSLDVFIVLTDVLIRHHVTGQGACACRNVRGAADPEF